MPPRIVRIGIDYGTSTSKVVFRDPLAPGSEKALVLIRDDSFRIPSSIAEDGSELIFGWSPLQMADSARLRWFESIKMRVAGEATDNYQRYCYGPLPCLPDGLTAKDLAILTLWFLITETHFGVCHHLRLPSESVRISVTMGIPSSFWEDSNLRTSFLEVARTSRAIYTECGPMDGGKISKREARQILCQYRVRPDLPLGEPDEIRNWIRPEAEAAQFPAVKSPAVPEGPYAEVDIGAGTTNASIFSVLAVFGEGRWQKNRLGFYGARSEPVGMDAVDAVLAERLGRARDDCLRLRGQERAVIRELGGLLLRDVMEGIRGAYVSAWRIACPRITRPDLDRYKRHAVFVTGGGALIPEISDTFAMHPDRYEQRLMLKRVEIPSDLYRTDRTAIAQEDMNFLAVAYGLSFDAAEVRESYIFREPAPRPTRPRENWEDM